jgi:hypothetical protein
MVLPYETPKRDVFTNLLCAKHFHGGIIGKSAPIRAEIAMRKSHPLEGSFYEGLFVKRFLALFIFHLYLPMNSH